MKDSERMAGFGAAELHGLVLLASLGVFSLVPFELDHWPLPIALPLALYAVVVLGVRRLRSDCAWLRVGRVTRPFVLATVAITLVASATLLGYQAARDPDLSHLDQYLKVDALGGVVVTGLVFSLVNAMLEEAVFRGILFEAIESAWGWKIALLASSLTFGFGHVGGYPPGVIGGVIAGIYGLALGVVRHRSGGLLLVIAAHACADATIMWIRVSSSE